MGTRNLTAVVINGEYKLAQYCQWDGYPGGQGLTVLQFVRDEMNREVFLDRLSKCKYWTETALQELLIRFGMDERGLMSWEDSKRFGEAHPELNRDIGASILSMIQNTQNGLSLLDRLEFAADSIFCEWAYVIDFDKNQLEAYKGFNTDPLTEEDRFFFLMEKTREPIPAIPERYYPVKLVHSWPLDKLPTDTEFLETLEP